MRGVTLDSGGDGDCQTNNIWKIVRNIDGPPKLKHFLWRACKNSLPVNDLRFRRHMASSPMCSRCGSHEETLCHALLNAKLIMICGVLIQLLVLFKMLPIFALWSASYGFILTRVRIVDLLSMLHYGRHGMVGIKRLWRIFIVILFNFRLGL